MVGIDRRRRSDQAREERRRTDVDATNGNPLGLQDLPSPQPLDPWRWFGLFGFVLLSLAMLATVIVVTAAAEKKTSLLQAEERRLQEVVQGRIKVLETWLEAQHAASRRLTDSHVLRLFVADLAAQAHLSPLPRSLQDQRPYFRQLMVDFARQNDLIRATVLRSDGAVLLSSPGPVLPVDAILDVLESGQAEQRMSVSAIRHADDRGGPLVADMTMAFPETQTAVETDRRPTALLVLTLPVESILGEVLSNGADELIHERISLLQQRGEVIEALGLEAGNVQFVTNQSTDIRHRDPSLAFSRIGNGSGVYSLSRPIGGVSWTLHHTLDTRAVLSPVRDFVQTAVGLSVLVVMTLAAAFSAFWWRQGSNHHKHLADLHLAHAHCAEQQRQFLEAVTTSMGDWLSVSSSDGDLLYANPAFEAVVSREMPSPSGKRWDDLIRKPSTTDASRSDLAGLIDVDGTETVEIGKRRYLISATASDLKARDGNLRGTVHVIRDHTELIAERRRRLQAMAQTVDAFIHAIELRDPFLLGHTDRVRTHAIAIGRRLGLSGDGLARLALAASLSQIGKVFIPDDILAKPDRHSPEEGDIMRDHILHAVDILGKINFGLPIVDIVAQMHERLDGSGYPHGLAGDDIDLGGRILGVADVFCARTAPRSYRDGMSAGRTLYHLASNEHRYDLKVVGALADVVDDRSGIDDPDGPEQGFVDSPIWNEKRRLRDQMELPA